MGYQFKGTVYIPITEFWSFVYSKVEIPDNLVGSLLFRYNKEAFEVVIESTESDEKFYIDGSDFWIFVQEFFPNQGAETRFSEPVLEGSDLRIECAMGDTPPEHQIDAPEWLKKG